MKKHRLKIISGAALALLLAVLFWWGGDAPGASGVPGNAGQAAAEDTTAADLGGDATQPLAEDHTEAAEPPAPDVAETVEPSPETAQEAATTDGPEASNAAAPADTATPPAEAPVAEDAPPVAAQEPAPPATTAATTEERGLLGLQGEAAGQDEYQTAPVPEGKPQPVEPQDVVVSDTAYTCTLTVSCATVLNNLERLNQEKLELVPADGIIFGPASVTFYEGESVFNVLQREMKKAKIHFEFVNTPIYNSAYIEGVNNIYEYDCGELSGWTYKVNGWFPNYGSSRYQLQSGDQVEWVYTCDLGADVGR